MADQLRLHNNSKTRKVELFVHPKKLIFFTIFFLSFVLSGALTILAIIPFRMGMASLLIAPLILFYGLKINRITFSYLLLLVFLILSAIFNRSQLIDIILFFRTLVFSFLIYYLVEIFINRENISKIYKMCVGIAIIQLPLVFVQQVSYDQLPARLTQGIAKIDYDFGTFNANDAPLAIFLTFLVIFLLYDKKHNYIIPYKWPIVLWLTLTVLVVNAELVKIIITLVWGIYLIRYLNIKIFLSSIILFVVIIALLTVTGLLDDIWSDFSYSFSANTSTDPLSQEAFLSGNYGRGAAIAYYLNSQIKWFGDGPSKYYNAVTRERAIGNTGHIFTFYSEVGLFAWLTSIFILFFIAFPGRSWRFRVSWVGILSFAAMLLLGFTTQIMNDISIFLIYCLINKSYIIPLKGNDEVLADNHS